MNNNSSNFFRESFRGYRKEDVNEYITETNLRFANKEKEYKDKICALTEKVESGDSRLCTENKKLLEQLETLKSENEFLLRKNGELHIMLEKAEKSAKEAIEAKEAEFNASQLKQNSDRSDNKEENVEGIATKVGNVLVIAQLNADKMIAEAKVEAEKIKKEAEESAMKTVRAANAKADAIISSMNKKVKEMSDNYLSQFGAIVSEIKDDFYRITENARDKADGLKKDIFEMKKEVDRHIGDDKERIINDISVK